MSDFPDNVYRNRDTGKMTLGQLAKLDALLTQLWLDEYPLTDDNVSEPIRFAQSKIASDAVRLVRNLHKVRAAEKRAQTRANGGLSPVMVGGLRYFQALEDGRSTTGSIPTTNTIAALVTRGLLSIGAHHRLTSQGVDTIDRLDRAR